MGAQHLRVPAGDLTDDLQARRLAVARAEGLQVAAAWLWSDGLDLPDAAVQHHGRFDSFELQLPGALWPEHRALAAIAHCRAAGVPLTLAPLQAMERAPGKYHARLRIGYHAAELPELNERLKAAGTHIDRVLVHVAPDRLARAGLRELRCLLPLSQIGALDLMVPLPGLDEAAQAERAAEALLAAALLPGCRLFLDPLVDVDRSSDINLGLLDRLSNPRPAFHAVRCLNTVLFGRPEAYAPLPESLGSLRGLQGSALRACLLSPGQRPPEASDFAGEGELLSVDLCAGLIRPGPLPVEPVTRLTLLVARLSAGPA